MEVKKRGKKFLVSNTDTFVKRFFEKNYNTWEDYSHNIFDFYSKTDKNIYIDIGAWIGPFVLYNASSYDKVIAIEPDPVAIKRLQENISLNNFDNITLIKKGLSNKNGKSIFGGNGPLGNSMSTLLVGDEDFLENNDYYKDKDSKNHTEKVEIETITIESLIQEQNIDPKNISMIKMDIEGGEKFVVPHIKEFLKKYKPVFFISLHYVFLKKEDVIEIINILFDIYDNCYDFRKGTRRKMTKDYVISKHKKNLVFE